MNKIIFLSAFCLLLTAQLFAQEKFEREYRLKKEKVPIRATNFTDSCAFTATIKWYKEESNQGISIEAKVKHRRHRYSIEFDTLGNIQDVEVKIARHTIPKPIRETIQRYLDSMFYPHRHIKTQLQWTGGRKALIALIRDKNAPVQNVNTKYEMVISGKKDGRTNWYELLFSATGRIERVSPIMLRNTDNLDY